MKRLLFVLTLFLAASAAAESSYQWFHHINATSDSVTSAYQDDSGALWLATGRGMFRYSPHSDVPQYDIMPEALRKGINELGPFPGGKMLVRTQDGVLHVYNPRTNQVESTMDELALEWTGTAVKKEWGLNIACCRDDVLWFYSRNTLYRKEPGEPEANVAVSTMGDEHIRSVYVGESEYCVVTDSLIEVYAAGSDTLSWSGKHGIVFHRSGIWTVIDRDGNIWIGSDRLYRYDRKTGKGECLVKDLSVMDMSEDADGNIMVATGTYGIMLYAVDGSLLKTISHKPIDPGSLASNNVRHLSTSSDGTLWITYNKPVISACRPNGMAFPGKHIEPLYQAGLEENVITMAQAPDGMVWFGTDGEGAFCMNPRSGSFSKPLGVLPQPAVTSVFFDSKGRTWVGSYLGGLMCNDGRATRMFLPNSSCFSMLEDPDGNLWAGFQGEGLYKIPGDLKTEPVNVKLKYSKWVFQLALAGKEIWAACSDGLYTIDYRNSSVQRIEGNRSGSQKLCNGSFKAVLADSRGILWLAGSQTECPLELYDVSRDTILYIPELGGHLVKSIVEDANHNIWITDDRNIIQVIVNYEPSSRQYSFHPSIFKLRNEERVHNYFNARSAVTLGNGDILFGGTEGYMSISPSAFPPYSPMPAAPKLAITAIRINDTWMKTGDISSMPGIVLKARENNLLLAVSSSNYTSAFETQLQYRISGKDEGWIQVRENIVELSRLSPGSNNLEISNKNPDGSIYGDILSFRITVKSPWYATWLAYLIYFIIVAASAAIVLYSYLQSQKHKLSASMIKEEAMREHRLNEMKLRFFTNISHDFRTPLSLIITPLESRIEDGKHKSEEAFLTPIYRNAVRLLNLVNQILDFRKLEADSVSLSLTWADIIPFIKDICSSFSLFADETSVHLDFSSPEESLFMAFDKDKVSKILMNLLSNAFKFTPEGGSVHVSIGKEDGNAVITVADTGKGIPDQLKSSVFERFFQVRGDSSSYAGSGIGLHIVKEFVELHDGSISISDNTPSGTIFSVTLPIKEKDAATDTAQAEPSPAEELYPAADSSGKAILIVEDNADFRNYLREQLSEDYTVYMAAEGESALEILAGHDVDIILSDIMMDGMDGLQLCRAVKTNLSFSHIPFILLTAKAMAEDEIIGLEYGADDYITKPFHMQILRLRIQKLLEDRKLSRKAFNERMDISPSEITITSLDEQFLSKAIALTEENMSDPDFSVEKLSSLMGVHRTNLYKKLSSLTDRSPQEFIRLIRLKRAAQYLAGSQLYVSEIAYRVGFNSPKVFSRRFKEEFGLSPREYQEKHEKQK